VSVGFSYLVTIPSVYCVGGRIRKQFKHTEAAKLYASVTFEGIRRVGISFTEIFGEDFGRVLSVLGEASKKTLGELCGELANRKSQMLERGHIRSVTERTFRGSCDRIKREIGSVRLRDITVRFVTNWIINFSGSTRTKRNYLNTLSEILNYGVFCEYIKENPIKRLPVSERSRICGPQSEKGIAILKVSEAKRLMTVAKQRKELGMVNAVCLGLFCGIRTEELRKLSWSNVCLENKVIEITSDIAKKRSIRYVSIPKNALSWLEQGTGNIVETRYNSHLNNKLSRLVELSGLNWERNMMRHSFASYHYALHGDSISTSRELGHRQGDTVLFSHYRNIVKQSDAQEYFNIVYSG
jgi:integrase